MTAETSRIVGEIRRQRVRGPHQRGFTSAKWSQRFSDFGDDSLDSKLLHSSGLLIHELMSDLRVQAEDLLGSIVDPRNGIFYVVAQANLAGSHIRDLMLQGDSSQRQAFDSSDLVSSKIDLGNGRTDSADELMLGLIDSVVYPIQRFLQSDVRAETQDAQTTVNWGDVLENANAYCLAYHFCQKAIYERKYASLVDGVWTVDAVDANEARLLAVADYFGQERGAERALTLAIAGPERLPARVKLAILPRRYVNHITTKGSYWTVRTLSRRHAGNAQIPDALTVAMATTTPGTVSLLDHPIDGIAPGTLRNLVSAWVLLSEIAEKWMNRQTSRSDDDPMKATDALLFTRKAIEALFSESIPTKPEVATAIYNFLSFGGGKHDDLWTHPLIPLGGESCALFVPSLVIPNTGRVIDSWIESTETAARARGAAFEEAVRTNVSRILAPFKSTSASHPNSIVLPGGQGEIDLLAIVDGVILVAELKCRKHPADPAERHYFRMSIRQAVNQILRVRTFLEEKRMFLVSRFENLLDHSFLPDLEQAPILPIVVTNQYYGSGIAFSGVPVFQFEFFLQQLGQKPFQRVLKALVADVVRGDDLRYPEPADAVLADDLKALPLPEYAELDSRLVPDGKRFSLSHKGHPFEERHFRTRSRHEAGTFFSTPGTAFKLS